MSNHSKTIADYKAGFDDGKLGFENRFPAEPEYCLGFEGGVTYLLHELHGEEPFDEVYDPHLNSDYFLD